MIQKELGHDYLSHTCKTYPLAGTINNGTILRYRVISCPAVYDLVTASPDACDVYTKARKEDITTVNSCFVDTEKDIANNSVLKYRNELFDFFYGILSNKNTDIITALISGILAASKIDEFASKDVKRIPEVIKALTPQMTNPATLKSLQDIAPNLSVKIPVLKNLFSSLGVEEVFRQFIQSGEESAGTDVLYISPEHYNEFHEKFRSSFTKDYVIKNVIRALYMDMQMPFNDKAESVFANYAYFAVCVAAIEYLGACIAASNNDKAVVRAKFKTVVCHLARKLCHNTTTNKLVLDFIKSVNCYTPGYISIIVK
jgi:lysine-N-methylase